MALSDRQTLEEMKKGDIIIFPFKKANLNTSSYDVTLGEYYFREQPHDGVHAVYNIYNKKHTERVWGTRAERAEKAKKAMKGIKFDWRGVHPEEKVILIRPGETILAHTNEFVGGRNHITTSMQARSSLGRNFIEVCKCAGWGDVGYINRWTMEVTNNSVHYTIPLVVGRRISQIVFHETGEILQPGYEKSGKYQTSGDLKKIKKDWKPEMMLPRLDLDRDIKK